MNIDRMLDAFQGCQVQFLLLGGVNFMLRCQEALPEAERKTDRVRTLKRVLELGS